MSDESQPPPLRLKPRLRVGSEPAPAAPAAAPVAPATESTGGGTGAESGNLRPPAPAPLPAVPATPPAAPLAAASGEKPEGIASIELRVRLKPRLAVNPQPGANQAVSDRLPGDMGGTPMPRGTGVPPVGLSGHAQADLHPPQPTPPAAPSGEIPPPAATMSASLVEPPPLSLPPIGMIPPVEKLPVEPPAPPSPMAAPAAEVAVRFKLKPKAPVPVPAGIVAPAAPATGATKLPPVAAATVPPPPSLVPVPVAPPPRPLEAPPPAKLSGAPHVPHIRAPGEEMPLPEALPSPVALMKRRRISKPRSIALLVAGGGIVVLAAYFALRVLTPSPPPPPASKVATKPALPPAGQGANAAMPPAMKDAVTPKPAAATPAPAGPTPSPSATLNQIAAAPKQTIDKAKEVVAARRGNEQARIDAMAAGEEAPDKRALDTPPPSRFSSQSPSPNATATPAPVPGSGSVIAPGITAVTNDVVAAPKASAAFTRFVADARITGVFQGTPPRAFINGRMIRAGEVVDQTLGVVFDSIDAEQKTITFKDRTGSPATRKY